MLCLTETGIDNVKNQNAAQNMAKSRPTTTTSKEDTSGEMAKV